MNAEDVTSIVKIDFKTLLMSYFLYFFNQNADKCQLGIEVRRLLFSHVPFILNLRADLDYSSTAIHRWAGFQAALWPQAAPG
jgi:hypothetical protein